MAKILKTDRNTTTIGLDNGSIKDVSTSSLSFSPKVGMEVEFYESDREVIVKRVPKRKRPVNKVIYILLAFFLGGFGLHKFYAGKTGMGILYLVFCWTGIPAIVGLIEAIIGLTKTADDNGNIYF